MKYKCRCLTAQTQIVICDHVWNIFSFTFGYMRKFVKLKMEHNAAVIAVLKDFRHASDLKNP